MKLKAIMLGQGRTLSTEITCARERDLKSIVHILCVWSEMTGRMLMKLCLNSKDQCI